jgi:hypothetical protein
LNPPSVVAAASLTSTVLDTPTASQWIAQPTPNLLLQTYTDLTVDATDDLVVTSAAHPFSSSSIEFQIVITSGLTAGAYTIKSVSGVKATLSASPGAVGTSGGVGTLTYGPYGTLSNGDFSVTGGGGGGNSYLVGLPWELTNGPYSLPANSPDYGPVTGGAHSQQSYTDGLGTHPFSLLLDNPNDSVGQTFVPPPLNATSNPSPNGLTKCFEYRFTCAGQLQNTGSEAAVAVILQAEDAENNILAGGVPVVLHPSFGGGQWTPLSATWSFGASLTEDPDHYRVILCSGPKNVGGNGLWVAVTSLVPIQNGPLLSASGSTQTQWQSSYPQVNGTYIVRDYGSGGMSFAGTEILSIPASTALNPADFSFRMGFVEVGGTSISWTNPLTWDVSSSHVYVDITTVPSAILASVRYLYIQFTGDLGATDSTSPIWAFGPLTNAGQLSVSGTANGLNTAPYYYVFTEVNDSDNSGTQLVNVIESDPSGVSNSITPTPSSATGQVVLPAPTNTGTTTWYRVYRGGGLTAPQVGYPLLIATVPVDADITMGTDNQDSDNLNPYISWNHSTRTLIDDTPDSFVFNAQVLQYGREQLPHGAQAICAWQNRIWLGVGATLYGSWNVVSDAEAGAYTTTLDSATDPSASIKGITLGVGAADNDIIVAMVPIGSYLFILKNYSVWILSGYDPTDFSLQQFLQYAGSGDVAPRAAVATGSDGPAYTPLGLSFNHVNFLGSDGLYSFDGSTSKPASVPLYTVLNVRDRQGNVLIPASVYSKIAMLFHNHRILIFAPEVFYYVDLAIDAMDTTKVTSVSRPFTSADVGASLNFTGGSGFTVSGSPHTVASVSGGAAVLSASAGTAGSTGGMANFAAGQNTVTWVFDTYVGGFTRYLIGGTSGCSLSAGSDTNDAIICDYTGQIYLLAGTGDKATPSSSLSPIPINIVTGGFGQGFGEQQAGDPGYYAKSRPTRLWVDVVSPGPPPSYTFTVTGTNSKKAFSTTYTPAEGQDTFTRKVSPSSEGPSVTVGVRASSVGRIRLRALGLDFSKGTITG